MPRSSSQKCANKRKNHSLPTPQAGSSRNVRPRLTQSSPAPALRSSPPPLLPSNADPFHPEKANRVPTDEMVGLWLATIASCDHRQDSALAVETIRKTMNIDLHWERILQAAGRPIRQHLDKTEAAKDLKAFVERTLRDELPFKLCWILAQTVKNAAHLAKLQQLLRLASEEYRGPLMTPSHRKQFQDLTNAWYLPNAGSSSAALRNELLSTAQHQPQEEVEVSDLEPRANLRPEHHANRRGASFPADEDPRTNNSPEAQPARRVESSSSRGQADLNPQSTPLLQPENLAGDRGPDVLHWELSRIRRTLAPRVAWFLDEERLRTMRGKDLLPDLIDDGRSLFAWYKLDELIEASGTRDPYAMHVERSWKRLDPNEKDAWENRFMRFRIQRIPIEHVRQRLEISGASLASTTPAPLVPSTATAPTASLQEPSVKVETVELSSDDDGSEEEQKPNLNFAGDLLATRQPSPWVRPATPGPSRSQQNQQRERPSQEWQAATPEPAPRPVTPASTQGHHNGTRPATHGSYSDALQRGRSSATFSSNQSNPTKLAHSSQPHQNSFTAINKRNSLGPST